MKKKTKIHEIVQQFLTLLECLPRHQGDSLALGMSIIDTRSPTYVIQTVTNTIENFRRIYNSKQCRVVCFNLDHKHA